MAIAPEPLPPRAPDFGASRGGEPEEDLVPEFSNHEPPHDPQKEHAIRGGAGWLLWIAALSLVNVIAAASGSDFSFAIGLVISQLIAIIGASVALETATPAAAWVFAVVAAAPALAFGGLWFWARRGTAWVFVLALVVYGIDLLVLLGILVSAGEMDVIGVGIHVWALWALFRGWTASRDR
jgi:hypothetical protein